MKKLPSYKITIDPDYSEDGQELGINQIAFVKNPAIKVKGLAFSNEETKVLKFVDEKKYRIAAPIMIPMEIYRCDDSEYYVQFTVEEIEAIHKKFMSTHSHKSVFNLEHDSEQTVPAYILECLLVDNEQKRTMIKDLYDIDVPIGTSFMVAQITDKDYYAKLVENEQYAFSIEGFLGLQLSEIINNKLKENNMKKNETKLADAEVSAYLELPVGIHTIGDSIYTVEEIVENAGQEDEYKHNVITKIEPKTKTELKKEELTQDEVKDEEVVEEVKEEMAEEITDEVVEEVKPEAPAAETYTKEEVDAKFDELLKLFAELKAELLNDEAIEDAKEDMPMQMSINDRFAAFSKFSRENKIEF